MSDDEVAVSVVVPCYTEERIDSIRAALASLRKQSLEPHKTIVAVDNNPRLADLVRAEFDWVTVVLNDRGRGASETRNRGVSAVETAFTAFLDDDEIAEPEWLYELTRPFVDPEVVGTGGKYVPDWPGAKPRWFPDEFAWAVGGSYAGLPTVTARVRNVWSGNMAVRTAAFNRVGGFRTEFGKQGSFSQPEDTDLCIRLAEESGRHWMYVPSAVILHEVTTSRGTFAFFVRRCFSEGAGKAVMSAKLGSAQAIETEHDYARSVAVAAVRRLGQLRMVALMQSMTMILGLATAGVGFLRGRLSTVAQGRGWS